MEHEAPSPPAVSSDGPQDDPTLLTHEQVAHQLGVDPCAGLTPDEAARRLETYGPNELRGAKTVPVWRRALAQFESPLIYLLLVAVAVSLIAWMLESRNGVPVNAIVITIIVLLNGILGFVQESRAADAVAALSTMTAANSTVLRGGELTTVRSADLVRGDILVLAEGDSVGADARLFSASALHVAEASLTGESEAADKSAAALTAPAPLGDRRNMVYKGTAVTRGVGRAIVTATGMGTEVGAIAEMLDATKEEPTPLQNEVDRIGRMLGITVIAIALVVMITIVIVNDVTEPSDFVVVLLLGVSLAVAAVPEGLPAILSVVLAIGVQRMARLNAVVKKLNSVEALGAASVICTDKTGTLTRNEMTIERIITASGRADLTGVGYRPDGDVLLTSARPGGGDDPDAALRNEVQLVLRAGALANDAQLTEHDGEWSIQGDPTEAAFLVAAHKFEGTAEQLTHYVRQGEVPFTSERKMMSTLHLQTRDGEVRLFSKGAPDVLLTNCTHLRVGADVEELTDERRRQVLDDVEHLSAQAFRTLGVAYRRDDPDLVAPADESLEHDLVFVGIVGIIDPPRVEAAEAIAQARSAGIRVVMITGDHPMTAARIASDLGLIEPGGRAATGTELDALDDTQLQQLTRDVSVYARVAPQHKLRLIDALQADGNIVSMTGDGVNDAPALKSADIGVAMGITGTEVTKEAARMILADDDFSTIVAAVRQGRVIFDNIKKFLRYLLSSNMGEVLTVFLGVVLAGALGLNGASDETIVLPLLATQILWINLITDSGPALSMGVDREIDDVMARRPRKLSDRAISPQMWRGIIGIGLVMALSTLFAIDLFLPGGFVPGGESLDVARTAGFTTLVFAQLFNAFNARSETSTAFRGMFTNRWLWGAIVFGVLAQVAVVQLPVLQVAFGTAPLTPAQWATCAALGSAVLWYDEARKLITRAVRGQIRLRRPS